MPGNTANFKQGEMLKHFEQYLFILPSIYSFSNFNYMVFCFAIQQKYKDNLMLLTNEQENDGKN